MKEYKAVPVKISPNGIILAMVNPKDITAINEVEFRSGVAVKPFLALHTQVMSAIKVLEKKGEEHA